MARESTHTSGVYPKRPLAIVRGQGAHVWDADGREYIDCVGGQGAANLGHAHPALVKAVSEQASRLISCPEIFYNDQRARLLSRLAEVAPAGLERAFLCNSGSEAIEAALKFARLSTGRPGIVAAMRGFHGRTLGALSATWSPQYREPFEPLLPGFSHVPFNDLAALAKAVNDTTAAVLLEVVQGEGGVHPAQPDFLLGAQALCRERGALLIVDEIQTGYGRTGKLFACQHFGIEPDLLAVAKSMAGGLPMGACLIGPRVGPIRPMTHGSTFGGNPLACAAALATLDVMQRTSPSSPLSLRQAQGRCPCRARRHGGGEPHPPAPLSCQERGERRSPFPTREGGWGVRCAFQGRLYEEIGSTAPLPSQGEPVLSSSKESWGVGVGETLPERAARLGEYLLGRLRRIESPLIREVRGLGLLVGVELKVKVTPILQALQALGVLALPAGGTVLRLLPPLVIEQGDLEQVVAAIGAALGDRP